MMKDIVFATNNPHKLKEARELYQDSFNVLSLDDIGCHDDIPETADTLEGNALIKAQWVADKYGLDCFADDTGLLVDALNGEPGVYSARYAGPHCSPADNMVLLLKKLDGVKNRNATFATVVALISGGQQHLFRGEVTGEIASSPRGTNGFGYDPVFIVENSGLTFAEMDAETKNNVSHRGRAMKKLMDFLSR